jgi:hypothetical protein
MIGIHTIHTVREGKFWELTQCLLGEFDGRMIVLIDLGIGLQSRRMSEHIGFETELKRVQNRKRGEMGLFLPAS